AATSVCLFAANITGTITVKQRLTRKSLTASVDLYDRGPAVELGKDTETDPLAAERARVVIWLEGGGSGPRANAPANLDQASMGQENRRFEPDLVVIPAGGSVSFPNMDPIFHNVFSLSKPKSFDLGNYPKGDTRTVVFPNPGIVFVNCRLHPNMAGTVVVTPNQWFARAGAKDGQYELRDVVPGTYTLVAWHKSTGFIRRQVTVIEGRDLTVDFLVPIDPNASSGSGKTEVSHMQGSGHDGAAQR
ncbi:MAG TPA: carboxypeptidase regulatory-like domain-containing protein, partial [Bryobacteraceae bacterium]|nr:carboxypeptidase regulatory-like domain-containing protein [Bryobacteraceae bacterium]